MAFLIVYVNNRLNWKSCKCLMAVNLNFNDVHKTEVKWRRQWFTYAYASHIQQGGGRPQCVSTEKEYILWKERRGRLAK